MSDLITSARAQYNLNNLSLSSNESTTLGALITAVSKAIQKYCGRDFVQTQYDELYNGDGRRRLLLRQVPIITVDRVAYSPVAVLRVTNTSASNQRATVAVTATGLSLTRVASGTSSASTVSFGSNTTISAVATAVTALGNGWSATVTDAKYNNRASADLRAVQGSLNAMNVQVELKIHIGELSDYEVDATHAWLLRARWTELAIWPQLGPGWYGGIDYWRVIYTAGFATVPEDVQEACAQWTAALFWQTKRDPGLSHESIPGVVSRVPYGQMPECVRQLLLPYRSRRLLNFGG
jgi:hypothetical protein